MLKSKNWKYSTYDSLPLIVSHCQILHVWQSRGGDCWCTYRTWISTSNNCNISGLGAVEVICRYWYCLSTDRLVITDCPSLGGATHILCLTLPIAMMSVSVPKHCITQTCNYKRLPMEYILTSWSFSIWDKV